MPDFEQRGTGAPDVAMGMGEADSALDIRSGSAKPLVRQVHRRMRHILSLDDLETAARRHLPRSISE
jgi:hypothetical protein